MICGRCVSRRSFARAEILESSDLSPIGLVLLAHGSTRRPPALYNQSLGVLHNFVELVDYVSETKDLEEPLKVIHSLHSTHRHTSAHTAEISRSPEIESADALRMPMYAGKVCRPAFNVGNNIDHCEASDRYLYLFTKILSDLLYQILPPQRLFYALPEWNFRHICG